MKEQKEFTRPITAEAAAQIEEAGNDARELASVLYIMQQAFFNEDGEPDPEDTANALGIVGRSVQRISDKLDHVMDLIYQRDLEKGKE